MYSLYPAVVVVVVFYIHQQDASIIQVPTNKPFPTLYPSPPSGIPMLPSIDDILTDGRNHPCYRDCNGPAMTCYYHFSVEWYQSMSKACFDCPFNITDCGRKDCVVANGVSRPVTVINRKMPGPSIEVCSNDKIIVDVDNSLMASGTTVHWHGMYQKETPFMDGAPFVTQCPILPETTFSEDYGRPQLDVDNSFMASGTTVHWHGMYQKETPFMDGAPFVTQCPILPETTFRYEFTAAQPGTYFWHSHIGLQRGDGAAGALVIRQAKTKDPHGKLYDHDKSEHVLFVADWINQLTLSMFTQFYHSSGPNTPTALLINGVGRFNVVSGNRTGMIKPPRFEVQKGLKYRFRLINAEFLNCPVELSVDGHNITVIASDGSDLEPVTASSLVSYSGERFDFIINATNKVDNYWIRVRGLMACSNEIGARQVGILHYKRAKDAEPSGNLTWPALNNNGLQINSVNQGEEQNVTMTISKLRSLQGYDDSLKPVPDYKFYISYDLYFKNNSHFNKLPFYGIHQVQKDFRVRTPQLNHISMKLPTSPLLVSRPSDNSFCNQSTIRDSCKEDYCQCPHVLSVKLNTTVELIMIDEGTDVDANHPLHLHGYSFRVVGQRRLGSSTTVDKVKAFDMSGQITRNLKNPPVKDTVTVPDGGYTIVRFKADNPGYWLFHCHIEFHAELGMALVFKVGEHKDMKPVPQDFPTCGNFGNGGFKSEPTVVEDVKNVKN